MADLNAILPGNQEGNFFVDNTCIDCDLCRQIAAATFAEHDDQSIVYRQPESPEETHRAAMALVACPTGSIGTRQKMDLRPAVAAYPEPVDGDVYFCGFASRNSFGAASYLVVRPEGNILIDSPRFAAGLVRRIEELGGVSQMLLTHQDDIADHERFHAHFGCDRVIHRADGRRIAAERFLDGTDAVRLDSDMLAIPTPGHTRGHVVYLYKEKYLFTGDHLAWSPRRRHLIAFRDANWYSWPETTRSMARLADYRFEWVLPGHGRRAHFTADVMAEKMDECVRWMKRVA